MNPVTDQESLQAVVSAMKSEHRRDMARVRMECQLLRAQLRANVVEPVCPDDDELDRLWNAARATLSSASDFVAVLGGAKELL